MADVKTARKFHFLGIGGYGMSGLAMVLLSSGMEVSGSDLKSTDLTGMLEKMGARVFTGHRASNLPADADVVVASTAIPESNPELVEARKRGLPIMHRSEVLARLINERTGIAIAGSHGKTTTTSMIALTLERAGLDPTALVGGEVPEFGGTARLGGGEYLVAEACESDRSFLRYQPWMAVVTNVEPDHLEHYEGDPRLLFQAFRGFLDRVKPGGVVVVCHDDPELRALMEGYDRTYLTYSLDREADFQARILKSTGEGTLFQVTGHGEDLGEVVLNVPGRHNVSNALAAIAVCRTLGVPMSIIASSLFAFRGAKRRFQVMGEVAGIKVVDDYAHHPTEIRATLDAARKGVSGRLIAVFQPQRFTRTKYLLHEFADSFKDADVIVLTEIYSAGEPPIEGISGELLARLVAEREGERVVFFRSLEEITTYLFGESRAGDMILTMGAGDVWKVASDLVGSLSVQEDACSRTAAKG